VLFAIENVCNDQDSGDPSSRSPTEILIRDVLDFVETLAFEEPRERTGRLSVGHEDD
jgi:hypothetical protein